MVVRSDLETKGDGKKVAAQYYDQLGRVRLSRTLEDAAAQNPDDPCLTTSTPCAGVKVQTRYLSAYSSPNGYTYQLTSNPYRASASSSETADTMGWTRSKGWKDGKRQEVETFSGSSLPAPWGTNATSTGKVVTETDATATTVTDQAGKLRRSITNALGQLVRVDEPDGSSNTGSLGTVASPNQPTAYAYDTLNNLTTVTQAGTGTAQCGPAWTSGTCTQTRTFTYSSLSRLLTAANPESGTTGYLYDNNGNLTKKTDARGVVTDYVYDALNRVTNRNYSTPSGAPSNYQATPNVTYTYDNLTNAKGKLTKVSSSVSTTEYTAFDILGRVTGHKQTTDGTDYTTAYAYNLSGAMIEQTYPSGRKVQNVLDNNGDLEMVTSRKNANSGYWAYANNFTYNAAGAVTSMQLGNGTWESTVFNERLQPTQIALGTVQNGYDKLKLNYGYGTTANNGNVSTQTISVATVGASTGFAATQSYNYDSLNRLKDAAENITPTGGSASQSWKQTFTYDRYGNRNFDEANTTTLPKNCGTSPSLTVCASDKKKFNPSVQTANNRLVLDQDNDSTADYAFDSSGNTTKDADAHTFVYDAENKQIEVKNSSNVTIGQYWYDGDGKRVKKYVPSTGETTIFVYDAVGKMVAEYSTVVAGTNDAQVAYLTNDHLGSPRINTDKNGNVTTRHDYHPFGEEIATSQRTTGLGYADDTVRKQFTGYERDKEIGLDFAQARYYAYHLGRFSSPDETLLDQNEADPQTWNLYSFVKNAPLVYVDSRGQWHEVSCSSETVGGSRCVEADEGDNLDTLADYLLAGNASDLKKWFQNQNVSTGQIFEVSGFMSKKWRPNDPGGHQVGLDLFLFFEGGRGLPGLVREGYKAAGEGLAWLLGRQAAKSASAAAAKVSIDVVEAADGVVSLTVSSAKGEVAVMADVILEGDTLLLKGVHIQGAGSGSLGARELNEMAKAFAQQMGEQYGVKKVVIEGGRRSGGINPGRLPRPRTYKVK